MEQRSKERWTGRCSERRSNWAAQAQAYHGTGGNLVHGYTRAYDCNSWGRSKWYNTDYPAHGVSPCVVRCQTSGSSGLTSSGRCRVLRLNFIHGRQWELGEPALLDCDTDNCNCHLESHIDDTVYARNLATARTICATLNGRVPRIVAGDLAGLYRPLYAPDS